MNPMFDRLQTERDGTVATLEGTVEEATAAGRDLTDEEILTRNAGKERIAAIDAQLTTLADDLAQNVEIASKIRKIGSPDTDFHYRNAGAALWDILHQSDQDASRRYRMATRAAEHMGTLAAHTTATAGDLGGLVVAPNVGAIVDPYPGRMPFLNWLGLSRIPSASFGRPYIDDPNFVTGVGKQAKEKGELPSKAFQVKNQNLSPETYGGYLNVSQQIIELQAGSLQIIINHLRKRLGSLLETAALTEVALTSGAVTLAADADAKVTQKAVYDAAGKVMTATQEPATFILMGPLGYARLGSIVDLANRPMFPYMGPANADGTSTASGFTSAVFGLHAIVTPAITDDTFYIGNGAGIEAWYYPLPLLEAVEPSVLGRQVAVAAMFAPYRPKGVENSIVKLSHT